VAEDKKYKSPEELGLAVGQKIEELFSGAFGESTLEEPPPAAPAAKAPEPKPMPAPPPKPVPKPTLPPRRATPFDDLMDRIEALILNLEWEAKVETIREAAQRFRELERFFPQDEQARAVVGMNYRVLKRYEAPDLPPHPQLVKLLQDSAQAVRAMHAHGKGGADRSLVSAIVKTYNQIAAASKAAAAPTPAPKAPEIGYSAVVGQVGSTVTSLEEVGQRLARIVARLKQGDQLTEEEITRRLGTLETLLSERISRLASLQREMVSLAPTGDGSPQPQPAVRTAGPDGLLMIDWGGVGLAIPSSFVAGLYPLPKAQAQQFLSKPAIMLGNRQVLRLPLKKPQNAPQKVGILPSWLIHLSSGGKDFFLLGDRALGFRRSPKGVDLAKETRIKIGNASYLVLNQAAFR